MPTKIPIPEWMQREVELYDLELDPPPQTILDIGANIGAYSLRCAEKWPDAHISAFEPVPGTFADLRLNLEHLPHAIPHCLAVRAESGNGKIFLGDNSATCSFHQRGRQTKTTDDVQCLAADLVRCAELVKVDTEGCEVEILEGLNLSATRAVVVEYHSEADRVKIIELLENASFQLLHQQPGSCEHGVLKFAQAEAGVSLPLTSPRPSPHSAPQTAPNAERGKTRKVYLAIAGHYGTNDVLFVQSLLAMAVKPLVSCAFGWSCDPSVERARNILTANFLESDCTHILFVDADIGFLAADVARICSHDELVVGGMYPLKTITPAVQWCANGLAPGDAVIREDGLSEVKYAGTGFLCVAREAFEKLVAHFKVKTYRQDFPPHRTEFAYWFQGVTGARFLTEDWNFCQLCRDMGIKIFLDSKVVLRHAGRVEWPLELQSGNPFIAQKQTEIAK